jgi:hypothetical protein
MLASAVERALDLLQQRKAANGFERSIGHTAS